MNITIEGVAVKPARVDTVTIFDFALRELPNSLLTSIKRGTAGSAAFTRAQESFPWLFYVQEASDNALTHADHLDLNCNESLPNFDRFPLKSNPADADDLGGFLTISQKYSIATVSIWRKAPDTKDPLEAKLEMKESVPGHYKKQLHAILPYVFEVERMYPFVGIRYNSTTIQSLLDQEGEYLGRVYSGGLDHERPELFQAYTSRNLSIRDYEALFVRSTDALAVYVDGVDANVCDDEELYERTLFRAVQVCETAMLAHRALRSFKIRTERDAAKVRIIPRPYLVEKRRTELSAIAMHLVSSLPFRSPEAPQLIASAQDCFGVSQSLADGKDSYKFLEDRYQRSKATGLALVAIATYLIDKLGIWTIIGKHLAKAVHSLIAVLRQ